MNEEPRSSFRAMLIAQWVGLVLWVVAVITLMFGPAIESEFMPVVTDVTFTVVTRDADRITVDWSGQRHRGHCELKAVAVNVWRRNNWDPAIISRAGDKGDAPIPGNSVPEGWQRFNRIDVIPDGSALRMTLRHRCHPLWLSVTQLPDVVL